MIPIAIIILTLAFSVYTLVKAHTSKSRAQANQAKYREQVAALVARSTTREPRRLSQLTIIGCPRCMMTGYDVAELIVREDGSSEALRKKECLLCHGAKTVTVPKRNSMNS